MCRPLEFPETSSLPDKPKQLETTRPTKSHASSPSAWTKLAAIVALVAFGFPIYVSEVIGGWTKQYTSPLLVPFGKLSIPSQEGKVVIVTGANAGIGYETSLQLAKAGAHVIVACRNPSKAKAAMTRIENAIGKGKAQLTFLPLDLSSLTGVREFATQFQQLKLPLHTLILNAGVMKSPGAEFVAQELTYGFETTQDGLEYHIGVNHVAHFYLTQLLLDLLLANRGRVIAVSSMAEQGAYDAGFLFHEWQPAHGQMPAAYEDGKAYGQSKLANLLFVKELVQRYPNENLTAYVCHPGVITTDLTRYMEPILQARIQTKPFVERMVMAVLGKWVESAMMGSKAGALTQLHLATANVETLENGAFYHPVGRPVTPRHPHGSNTTLQSLLWYETERVIQQLV